MSVYTPVPGESDFPLGLVPDWQTGASTIKASPFDPRFSVFLQEKHRNRRNRSGTSTQQNNTADESSTKPTT